MNPTAWVEFFKLEKRKLGVFLFVGDIRVVEEEEFGVWGFGSGLESTEGWGAVRAPCQIS